MTGLELAITQILGTPVLISEGRSTMNDAHRQVGDRFTATEAALLDLLCSGADEASEIARAQRAGATWGGYEHPGCECFLIRTDSRRAGPPIDHDGGPIAMAEVSNGNDVLGLLELWTVDGHLHSVNYMPFGDDHAALPSPDTVTITLTVRSDSEG